MGIPILLRHFILRGDPGYKWNICNWIHNWITMLITKCHFGVMIKSLSHHMDIFMCIYIVESPVKRHYILNNGVIDISIFVFRRMDNFMPLMFESIICQLFFRNTRHIILWAVYSSTKTTLTDQICISSSHGSKFISRGLRWHYTMRNQKS